MAPEVSRRCSRCRPRRRAHRRCPDGVIVAPMSVRSPSTASSLRRHLGSLISSEDDVFVALNDASFRAGTFVYVPRGVTVPEPIALADGPGDARHRSATSAR